MARHLTRWLALASLVVAPAVVALPCANGSLADYIAIGSCEIGDAAFSGFETLPDIPSGATEIAPNAIFVSPVATATDVGLAFAFDVAAGATEVFSTLFRFQLEQLAERTFTGVSSSLAGGSAGGDGVVLLIEDLCVGALFATAPTGCGGISSLTTIAFVTDPDPEPNAAADIPASTRLDVVAQFIVDGGSGGAASLGTGTLRFAAANGQAPEPGGPLLLLTALGLAAWSRQRYAARHA
jgi:hypothetical protein